MSHGRHYPNAPITEALIDLRVRPQQSITLDTLKKIGDLIRSQYPLANPRIEVHAELDFQKGASSRQNVIGYVFHSTDRFQAVQARLDGFTFSRFKPYQDWKHLASEAKRLWEIYLRVAAPELVERVAVRYINRLDLPTYGGALHFEQYLKTFPTIGKEAGQELEGFLVRLILSQRDLDASLVLTEALIPPANPKVGSVILDIDLYRNLQYSPNADDIWVILEKFRERKNLYFEASITDDTRKLFA